MNTPTRKVRRKGVQSPVFYSTLIEESPNFFIVRTAEGLRECVHKSEYELVPEPVRKWVDITDMCAVEDGHLFDQTNLLCQRLILGPNAPVTPGYRVVPMSIFNPLSCVKAFGIEREDLVQS